MMLWLSLAILTLLVLVLILRPLLTRNARVDGGEDAEVYAAQLREVEVDRERGLIADDDAASARAEIGRRLLRARHGTPGSTIRGRGWGAAAAVAILVPAVSLGAYAVLGTPTYGDQPLALRLAPIGDDELREMLATAEARLAERPDDGEGWVAVAPVYQRMGRFEDAANAYGRAIALLGATDDRLIGRAESLTFANHGEVTDDARAIFVRLAEANPDAVTPRIFLAVADRQRGDFGAAAERWRSLIGRSRGDEPWLEIASAEFTRMGGDDPLIADDPVGMPPPPTAPRIGAVPSPAAGTARAPWPAAGAARAPGPAAGAARAPGPSVDQVAAAAGMTDDARQAMIGGMVERLAERLAASGGSADEWLRLIGSLRVLGRTDEARAAAEQALASLAGDDRARVAGADEVRELLQ